MTARAIMLWPILSSTMGERRRCGNYSTLLFTFRFGSVAIGSRVDLDSVSADLFAGFYLIVFRIDEEAYMGASILKAFDGLQNFLFVCHDIETTFCGKLLSLLRNEASIIRS